MPASHYVLVALFFFAGLELINAIHQWIVVPFVILLLLTTYGIALVRWEEGGSFLPSQSVLPVLMATGLAGFSLFLPLSPWLHVYYAASAGALFLLLKHGARQAYPTWNWVLSTAVLFFNCAVILGLRFHLYMSVLLTLGLLFAVVFLIAFQAIRRAAPSAMNTLLLSLGVALALTQLAWVLQFLPLGYIVQAGVILVFYYVFFHLLNTSFERPLNLKDGAEYAVLGSAALLLLLLTTQWI